MKKRTKRILSYSAIVLATVLFMAYSTNPPDGKTGAPGEGLCSDAYCHSSSPGSFTGDVVISGLPSSVTPGNTYPITVTVNNTDGLANRAGFQLVALDDSNNTSIGTMAATSGDVAITAAGNGRTYAEHNPAQNFNAGVATFSFDWTAPASGTNMTMYAAANIADGTGNTGDVIVTTTASSSLAASALEATAIGTDITCNGANDGTANVSVTGGTEPYTYEWSNGETSVSISGLAPGTYTVTASDSAGETATASVTLSEPSIIIVNASATDETIANADDGTATANPTGGTPPYNYLWSNFSNTQSISDLAPGSYTVAVIDANGCQVNQTVIVNEFGCNVTATVTFTNHLECFGASDGSAIVQGGGGITPYEFNWSNGATTPMASGLSAGTYSVTVTDEALCASITSVTITQPDEIIIDITSTDVLCNGTSTGTASATVSGGTGSYTYAWSNGNTTAATTGLAAGTYSLTVTDDNNCEQTTSFVINEPPPLVISGISSTDALCNGDSNGSAEATAEGGTPPYSYAWSNGMTAPSISNLAAGTYFITVTDDNGCATNDAVVINEPDVLVASATATDALCNGDSNGTASASATGGTLDYSYMWSNGETTADISGLAADTYTVTITDANGCSSEASVTVSEPEALEATASSTDAVCNDSNDGTASVAVTGGTAPYTYEWTGGETTDAITDLEANTYDVTVTDTNGCVMEASTTVNAPNALEVNITDVTDETDGDGTGAVTIEVVGGTAPYEYMWSNGSTSMDISGLSAGDYTVTVTDANGCETVSDAASVSNTVDVLDLKMEDYLSIFPNPVRQQLNILWESPSADDAQILLMNISGQAVAKQTISNGNNVLDVSNIPSGIYLLKVQSGESFITKKVVVKD